MDLKILRRPFVVLLTVPAAIALFIGCLPFLTSYAENQWFAGLAQSLYPQLGIESARTALTVVGGGAMTALSLTYSLVLVVFTLAAGNIGPRMLKRFTSDLVNQITAGIFGGTFLYALMTLLLLERTAIPKLTILGAGCLAILCVMQLIYFVRHVSRSVTIDDEIAEITENLKTALKARHQRSEAQDIDNIEEPDDDLKFEICANTSGYICAIAEAKLLKLAEENDFRIKLMGAMGEYILSEEVLFSASKELDDDLVEAVQALVMIEPSRSEDSPIEFSINLLLEIALRALSPGVNDTFTAVATVDSLSNALSAVVSWGDMTSIALKDSAGTQRVIIPEFSVEHLINQAFHPLRRAASENILMSQCIARAYTRLYENASEDICEQLIEHGALLIRELESSDHFEEDIKTVLNKLPTQIREQYNPK
jgi:uncharacterized membrane protein